MLLLDGCLYTTQHFGGGRVLEPGETAFALAAGRYQSISAACADEFEISAIRTPAGRACQKSSWTDSMGTYRVRYDTVPMLVSHTGGTSVGMDWRLGLHGPFGPFPGAEAGIHLEVPTNPATAEFDLKVGLPAPTGSYRHALAGGWGIGLWADNSWFGEYAASYGMGRNSLFANYRATWLATQIMDLGESVDERHFPHKRRLIQQAALGFAWKPFESPSMPAIIPLLSITYPQAPMGDLDIPAPLLREAAFDFALGFRWGDL